MINVNFAFFNNILVSYTFDWILVISWYFRHLSFIDLPCITYDISLSLEISSLFSLNEETVFAIFIQWKRYVYRINAYI